MCWEIHVIHVVRRVATSHEWIVNDAFYYLLLWGNFGTDTTRSAIRTIKINWATRSDRFPCCRAPPPAGIRTFFHFFFSTKCKMGRNLLIIIITPFSRIRQRRRVWPVWVCAGGKLKGAAEQMINALLIDSKLWLKTITFFPFSFSAPFEYRHRPDLRSQ